MSERETSPHLSALTLETLGRGGLSEAARVEAEKHLVSCADCRAEQAALLEAQAYFNQVVRPRTEEAVVARVLRRAKGPSVGKLRITSPRRRLALAAAALALSAAALWLLTLAQVTEPDRVELAMKGGGSGLSILVSEEGKVLVREGPSVRVQPGEEIGFVLTRTDLVRDHVLIAGVDAAGSAQIYFPFQGKGSAPLPAVLRWQVPATIELDSRAGPERIFVLLSSGAIESEPVLRALSRLGRRGPHAVQHEAVLPLPDIDQHSVLLDKTAL